MKRINRLVFLGLAAVATLLGLLQGIVTDVWVPMAAGLACLLAAGAVHGRVLHRARKWRLGKHRHWSRLLHASNAWHCGCAECCAARMRVRGDVRRTVIPGPWPIRVETWVPSKSEWQKLRGRE